MKANNTQLPTTGGNFGRRGNRTWGRNTGLEIISCTKTRGRYFSALVGSNQVKHIRIFLSFLNSELCPCITSVPYLCDIGDDFSNLEIQLIRILFPILKQNLGLHL